MGTLRRTRNIPEYELDTPVSNSAPGKTIEEYEPGVEPAYHAQNHPRIVRYFYPQQYKYHDNSNPFFIVTPRDQLTYQFQVVNPPAQDTTGPLVIPKERYYLRVRTDY